MLYIALLRGINVGTTGRIRMDTLKHLLEEASFSNVSTYIQSGNVLFDSPLSEIDARETLEHALKIGANIQTTAVLRSVEEWVDLTQHCPFSEADLARAAQANTGAESLYVCLLPQKPEQAALDKLSVVESGEDTFAVYQRNIFLLLHQSIRTSKCAIRAQKVFPDMTVRNWNTMLHLLALAQNEVKL